MAMHFDVDIDITYNYYLKCTYIHTYMHNIFGNAGWFTMSAEADVDLLLH